MSAGKVIIDHGGGEGSIDSADVHPKLCEHLEFLLDTGLYGHSTADVAVRLIERGVRRDLKQRIVTAIR